MSLKNFSFLALRSLGCSPCEAGRVLGVAVRSGLGFGGSVGLCLAVRGGAPLWAAPGVAHDSAFLRAPVLP